MRTRKAVWERPLVQGEPSFPPECLPLPSLPSHQCPVSGTFTSVTHSSSKPRTVPGDSRGPSSPFSRATMSTSPKTSLGVGGERPGGL